MDDDVSRLQFRLVPTNGIRLHVAEASPAVVAGQGGGSAAAGRRLVLLLHGFPEFWYGWRHQIGFLADHGYRIWAPDQRGYNLSDKPRRVADYSLESLARDVVGLIEAAGEERAHLIGHDWGAVVGWWTALRYPERVARMVVMNVPHPAVMERHVRTNFAQLRRSWYAFAFQVPWLPEKLGRLGNWKPVVRAMTASSRPGTFTAKDWDRYREAWSQPNAYRSMIHWYRAALRARPKMPPDVRIHVPTLVIWGARDKFLGREMALPSVALCEDGRLAMIEEATHWVQHEEPDRVNGLILEHLAG